MMEHNCMHTVQFTLLGTIFYFCLAFYLFDGVSGAARMKHTHPKLTDPCTAASCRQPPGLQNAEHRGSCVDGSKLGGELVTHLVEVQTLDNNSFDPTKGCP